MSDEFKRSDLISYFLSTTNSTEDHLDGPFVQYDVPLPFMQDQAGDDRQFAALLSLIEDQGLSCTEAVHRFGTKRPQEAGQFSYRFSVTRAVFEFSLDSYKKQHGLPDNATLQDCAALSDDAINASVQFLFHHDDLARLLSTFHAETSQAPASDLEL